MAIKIIKRGKLPESPVRFICPTCERVCRVREWQLKDE